MLFRSTAAKEIKQLITDSVDNVASGTKQVQDAGETMEEIVIAVKMVTDIVNEIAAASQEQSSGIDQVNNAITNMDEVVQQNAALVEEAAAAASSLESKAEGLTRATSLFKLGTDSDYHRLGYEDNADEGAEDNINRADLNQASLNKVQAARASELPHHQTKNQRLKAPKVNPKPNKDADWEEF